MKKHSCKDCLIMSEAAKSLSPEDFEILESNAVQVLFKKGEVILKQGAISTNVAFLKSGLVKIHMQGPVNEKILRIIKAPSYLGITTTFGVKLNQFSATALEATTVCFIDSNIFREFIYKNGKFAHEIIIELCNNELYDYQKSVSLSQKQIPGLVAETLLCMSDKIFNNDKFCFPLTRNEMSDMIGTTRESISRVLTEFSNDKIIELHGSEISILNKELLIQISEKG